MAVTNYETIDKEAILNHLEGKSAFMCEYVKEHIDSEFLLIYKYITHSDLPNRGKRNGTIQTIERNFLYYLSDSEMKLLEDSQEKPFESAKQSNIGISSNFFKALNIDQLQRRIGQQQEQHNHVLINDYANVYVVNDTLEYFSSKYTRKILDKFNKKPSWYDEDIDIVVKEGAITPVKITHAIHGIGTSDDSEFAKLRLNIFKNDILTVIIESRKDFSKNVFILLEKNPIFFSLLGINNLAWQKYSEKQKKIEENNLKNKTIVDIDNEEKTRKQQSKWRNMLAEEMMNYSTTEGEVFCPLTYLTCNFEELGTLFRASHIKSFIDCDDAMEAYDINNGLLLCANADALFDKHLITIDENKELVFSFLLKHNAKLINNLLLTQPIFKLILNDERMKYLEEHRKVFYQLEKIRKTK